jgi:pimeloyl-ACP methyl ester carboxylesterase
MPAERSNGAALSERVVPFTTADGVACNVINVRGAKSPAKPPVLLVHGAGVRANIFRAPNGRTLVDALVDAGHDVWLENWRASIDIPHNRWTLDQAAVFDHPAAVQTVLRETRTDELDAVVHCQGSTSFMMSAVAGLVPEVTTIVSNAVSLHPVVPRLAKLKLRYTTPIAARAIGYINPQWRLTDAPWIVPKALTAWVMATHHECDNDVCKLASYVYGTGKPTLWLHENLNAATHDWLRHEFADVPLTFFEQISRCVQAGHLVSVDGRPELPVDFTAQPPQTDARFVFVAGESNACFLPASQQRTFTWFERHAPGRHALHTLPGYGHLDVFMGKDAAAHVYPTIIDELGR